jgi:hypothetical protein
MKRFILNKILKYLYNSISEDDILIYSKVKKSISYNGSELSDKQIDTLKADIKVIRDLQWWQLMRNEMKYVANKMIFELILVFCRPNYVKKEAK